MLCLLRCILRSWEVPTWELVMLWCQQIFFLKFSKSPYLLRPHHIRLYHDLYGLSSQLQHRVYFSIPQFCWFTLKSSRVRLIAIDSSLVCLTYVNIMIKNKHTNKYDHEPSLQLCLRQLLPYKAPNTCKSQPILMAKHGGFPGFCLKSWVTFLPFSSHLPFRNIKSPAASGDNMLFSTPMSPHKQLARSETASIPSLPAMSY